MSFTLKSVELNNIRAHEHFKFEPASSGITAISGDNGAGKSTIVDAFAWSLYGTRPSGIRNKNLIKDGVNPRSKPVSVRSVIVSGGIEYAIERKIITPQGAVECNIWGKKPGADEFKQVAGPAVTHVEKFIRSELGMNEKGFLTSVLIQQKQVDQIVSATPRERGAVIEELTGIASITEAITKTNENTRSLEKAARMFHVGDIDEAKSRVDKQELLCKETSSKEKAAKRDLLLAESSYKELYEKFKIESEKVEERIKLSRDIEGLSNQIEFLNKQSKDDLAYIKEFDDKYGESFKSNSSEVKDRLDKKQSEGYEVKSLGRSVQTELRGIEKELAKADKSTLGYTSSEDVSAEIEKLNSKKVVLEKEIDKCKSKISMLNSEIKHSSASHEHINGKDENCPVCNSKLDNPEALKKEIENNMKSFEEDKASTSKKLSDFNKELRSVSNEIGSLTKAKNSVVTKDALTIDKDRLSKELSNLADKNLDIEKELKEIKIEHDEAVKEDSDRKYYDEALKRSSVVNETIEETEGAIKDKNKEIDNNESMSDKDLKEFKSSVEEERENLASKKIYEREMMGRKELELERLEDYKVNLKEAEKSLEKYEELSEQIQISSSASAMLSAFKADRIEHAIPTLEFFASDYLSKFTGGAFTKLSVDEKFNTFVTTSDNVERPVAQLSGGELSSAAIALRLGIAMLLNSSEKNVLILDEVLVSMDEDRSRQIMETIGSMTNSQVIFIAHNNDINSVADKTVLVSKKNVKVE